MKRIITVLLVIMAVGVFAQAKVQVPMPVAPVNESGDNMPDVVLSWDGVPGSADIMYRIEIDIDPDFSNPTVGEVVLISGWVPGNLFFNTMYYWRVRAEDMGEISAWSEVFSFTTFEKPKLATPSNDKEDIDVVAELKWNPKVGVNFLSGFHTMEVQYDTSANFDSQLLTVLEGDIEAGSVVETNPLEYGTKYYWRARAVHDDDMSEWSDVYAFTTWYAPELDEPANQTSDLGFWVTLEWEEIEGSLMYEVLIATDEAFTNPVIIETIYLEYTTPVLAFNQTYYWKVRAFHATASSDYSEVREFSTVNAPMQIYPADGDTAISPLTTQFEWAYKPGISHFEIQYALDEAMTDSLFTYTQPDTSIMDPGTSNERSYFNASINMSYKTDYYWRIRYIHPERYDTSSWSPTWTFKTESKIVPGNITETDLSSNMNIFPNPATDKLSATFSASSASKVEIAIYSLTGKMIKQEMKNFSSGDNQVNFDINDLSDGIYMMRISGEDFTATKKFVVN